MPKENSTEPSALLVSDFELNSPLILAVASTPSNEELKILKQTQLLKMTEEFNKMNLEQQKKLVYCLQVTTKY